jgi:hypothetical protein
MNSFDVVIIGSGPRRICISNLLYNLVSKQQLSRNTQFLAELVLT